MAVAIRLSRHGTKKRPYYHIVVADSREARDSGNVLETVGKYDPMQPKGSEKRVIINTEKVQAWLSKGARPTDRVYKFLANAGLLKPRAIPVQTKKDKPSEKTLMKQADKEKRLAKIAEEKAAAEEAAKAATEAPAEEAVAEPVAEAPVAETTETAAE